MRLSVTVSIESFSFCENGCFVAQRCTWVIYLVDLLFKGREIRVIYFLGGGIKEFLSWMTFEWSVGKRKSQGFFCVDQDCCCGL